jgi:branched-chain amino acid transport system substrate-binding protein
VLTPLGWRTAGMSDMVFCTGLSPAFQGKMLARFVAETGKSEPLAVLVDDGREDGSILVAALVQELKQLGNKTTKGKTVPAPDVRRFGKEPKFEELARWVEEKQPAALVFAGSPHDLLAVRRSLKKSSAPLLYAGDEEAGRILPDAAATGVLLVSAYAPDSDLPPNQDFINKFRTAFSTEPGAHAALACDAIRLFDEAFRRCEGNPSSEQIRSELLKIKDFPGLTGPLAFADDGRLRRPGFILQVEKGQLKTRKTFTPED